MGDQPVTKIATLTAMIKTLSDQMATLTTTTAQMAALTTTTLTIKVDDIINKNNQNRKGGPIWVPHDGDNRIIEDSSSYEEKIATATKKGADVQIAYEVIEQFPNHKIGITNEIIHNTIVNKCLEEMKVENIPIAEGKKQFEFVNKGDVVMLPAFGAVVDEMLTLSEKNVQIVDTTCEWVSTVWNIVEKHKREDYTSIIHGKYAQKKTVATMSFAEKYVIMKNMADAKMMDLECIQHATTFLQWDKDNCYILQIKSSLHFIQ
ncbi:putative 4-hydroxy-3-methylbut-2-enyl diphosphate reductase [Medicago truncatula]|uniref:4-hydroxy-3-methylbut-2-enyl diphosphate reductase n=1 Tax=Medicago truncatula TaxID=3880 RepID=G8A1H8_MEDTR|nr:LYTB protein [Medicago truncatula]RHN81297.1 putative 4-hydroxy-3-methylbut-2-enyl diphosphate reductase [Medicago truncatula]